jgi:cobalt-zinc-cadmium efflux system membrane fusion protein
MITATATATTTAIVRRTLRGSRIHSAPHALGLVLALSLGACSSDQTDVPADTGNPPLSAPANLIPIAPADYTASRIRVAVAAPAQIDETLDVYGEISVPRERLRDLSARYPGIVRSVNVRQGDGVHAGDTLLTIESSDSLRTYRLTSPIDGVVLDLNTGSGESVRDEVLVTVADLGQVYATLTVFSDDIARVGVGQPLRVSPIQDPATAVATQVGYIGAHASAGRGISVRAALDNADRRWIPGQFVRASITVARHSVAVAVPADAVQSIDATPHVFVETPDGFVATPVSIGTADAGHFEILDGIAVGTRVAAGNTFMLKSELLTREEE